MSDDLIAFLKARLDEDERCARPATPGPWRHNPDKHWRKPGTVWFEEAVFSGPRGAEAICVAGTGESDHPQAMANAAHIARHDPARILREVEAKRAMVDAYAQADAMHRAENYLAWASNEPLPHPEEAEGTAEVRNRLKGLHYATRLLALPHADHPDYKEEWRP